MNKTEDILERLKGQMPQVPDADLLTESIMASITNTGRTATVIPMWLKIVRFASCAAAVILIALFLGLDRQYEEETAEKVSVIMKSIKVEQSETLNLKLAIKRNYYRAEKRKARQLRETQIKNLYANF